MPRQRCTVCTSPHKDIIDGALRNGTPPMRVIAKQCGVSLTAVFRHKQHGQVIKALSAKDISEEIRRLRIMLAKAKRKGNTNGAIAISREIRAWMAFESKQQTAMANDAKDPSREKMSHTESLHLAKQLIEADLRSPSTIAWFVELYDRLRVLGDLTEGQE